jgi:peptidoglycan/LPS O-acetylase OafA/YrhL
MILFPESAMNRQSRTQLVLGILLVALGIFYLIAQQNPTLREWTQIQFEWPFFVIGAGLLILVIGLLTGTPSMAIPASIVTGISCILYYQNRTGDWTSWAFLWTLIPGFVGIGIIIAGLLGEDTRNNLGRGLNLLVISGVLFVVFAAIFGRLTILGPYGAAVLLILFGLYIIGRGLLRGRRSDGG